MVLKKCVVCGKEFNALGRDITCGEKCAKINKSRYDYVYYMENNKEYYRKNWLKWREYAKSRKKLDIGTSDLSGKMQRHPDGEPDFDAEGLLVKREMMRTGLVYSR